MSSPEEVLYPIVSSDNVRFDVPLLALNLSTTLRDLVINLDCTAENVPMMAPIPCPNVDGSTLRLIVQWCERHMDDDRRIPVYDFMENIPQWDQTFFEALDDKQLYDVMCAANFLNIKELFELSCKRIAFLIRGKRPQALREIFVVPANEEETASNS